MDKKRIILPIDPYQQVLTTQGVYKLFYIPRECPKNCGLPRRHPKAEMVALATMKETHPDLYEACGGEKYKPRGSKTHIRYGCPHMIDYHNLLFLNRVIKYQEYKKQVKEMMDEIGATIPDFGWSLYFYIPMPVSWSKKKRKEKKGRPHDVKPDQKNLLAAFEDALRKDDEKIGQMSGLGKFWIDTMYLDEEGKKQNRPGYIEILLGEEIYNPFNVKNMYI